MTRFILGCDPGGTTGLALLDVELLRWELVQCTPGAVLTIAAALLPPDQPATVAIEKFVVGQRAGRSANPAAGETTRNLIGALAGFGGAVGATVVLRPAVGVKRWATNRRLYLARLQPVPGMSHATDGARHALFEACHSGLLPDPLSRDFHQRRSPR